MTDSKLLLVLICGIPGSGKSTFAARLQSSWTNSGGSSSIVSFDDIDEYEEWNETTFKTIRKDGYQRILSAIQQSINSRDAILIIDDIMYLKSMRRGVYKLARDHCVPLLTVCVNTTLAVAKERNIRREGRQRIPDGTIEKIYQQFEEPSSSSSIVDRFCLKIDGNSEESMIRGISECIATIKSVRELYSTEQAQLTARIQPHSSDGDTLSFIGRLDGLLRKIISLSIKEVSSTKECEQVISKLGKAFAGAKSETLTIVRTLAVVNDSLLEDECKRIFIDEVEKAVRQCSDEVTASLVCNVLCKVC